MGNSLCGSVTSWFWTDEASKEEMVNPIFHIFKALGIACQIFRQRIFVNIFTLRCVINSFSGGHADHENFVLTSFGMGKVENTSSWTYKI